MDELKLGEHTAHLLHVCQELLNPPLTGIGQHFENLQAQMLQRLDR